MNPRLHAITASRVRVAGETVQHRIAPGHPWRTLSIEEAKELDKELDAAIEVAETAREKRLDKEAIRRVGAFLVDQRGRIYFVAQANVVWQLRGNRGIELFSFDELEVGGAELRPMTDRHGNAATADVLPF